MPVPVLPWPSWRVHIVSILAKKSEDFIFRISVTWDLRGCLQAPLALSQFKCAQSFQKAFGTSKTWIQMTAFSQQIFPHLHLWDSERWKSCIEEEKIIFLFEKLSNLFDLKCFQIWLIWKVFNLLDMNSFQICLIWKFSNKKSFEIKSGHPDPDPDSHPYPCRLWDRKLYRNCCSSARNFK